MTVDYRPPEKAIDIGSGVFVSFYRCYRSSGVQTPGHVWPAEEDRAGLILWHPKPAGGRCAVSVPWRQCGGQSRELWTLESMEPLTLSPSIVHRMCGAHGFISEGRWVPC